MFAGNWTGCLNIFTVLCLLNRQSVPDPRFMHLAGALAVRYLLHSSWVLSGLVFSLGRVRSLMASAVNPPRLARPPHPGKNPAMQYRSAARYRSAAQGSGYTASLAISSRSTPLQRFLSTFCIQCVCTRAAGQWSVNICACKLRILWKSVWAFTFLSPPPKRQRQSCLCLTRPTRLYLRSPSSPPPPPPPPRATCAHACVCGGGCSVWWVVQLALAAGIQSVHTCMAGQWGIYYIALTNFRLLALINYTLMVRAHS